MPTIADNPFAILSFLAGPALLTNASTLLALGTSNRLARAADRTRLLSASLLGKKDATDPAVALLVKDFGYALERSKLLIRALRCFYLAAGGFAAGTCVSLVGATSGYFSLGGVVFATEAFTLITVAIGVGAIVRGASLLVTESRIALTTLDAERQAVEAWRKRVGPST